MVITDNVHSEQIGCVFAVFSTIASVVSCYIMIIISMKMKSLLEDIYKHISTFLIMYSRLGNKFF